MKKLNKLGISILLGYFLVNSLNEKDFENFKNKISNFSKKIEPKLTNYFNDLNNIVKQHDDLLFEDEYDKKVLTKLSEIKDELENVKADQLANLLLENIKKKEEDDD